MKTTNAHVTRRALTWALAMTIALYAMLWAGAGAPTVGAAAGPAVATQTLQGGAAR